MENKLANVLRLAAGVDAVVALALLGLILSGSINLPVVVPLLLLLAAAGLFIGSLRVQ